MRKAITIFVVCLLSFQFAMAQPITTHQYRRVAPENMQEYLKRETTSWAKWAEKEVTKGNLTFWAILQKIGGVLGTNNTLPILEDFLFELDEEKLRITASDLETTISVTLTTTKSEGPGIIAIPAKMLLDIMKTLPDIPD